MNVACIDANVLGITAKIGSCNGAGGGGGGGAGDGAGGGGERGAADAEAGSGELGANAGVGCVDIGLGDLGNGLQIGSCEAIMPPSTEDPGDEGSGELPTETGDGVAGADAGADGSAGTRPTASRTTSCPTRACRTASRRGSPAFSASSSARSSPGVAGRRRRTSPV